MAFYHFKSSVLAAEIPTIEPELYAELHVGQKFLSQTETNKISTETSMTSSTSNFNSNLELLHEDISSSISVLLQPI